MTEHITIGDVSPRIQYAADGAQTQFTYPFPIFEAGDLKVWFDDTAQTSGFTVSGAGNSAGGTVDFDAPPAAGLLVTLRREVPIERTTDFQEGGAFRAKTINDELDRQTAMIQQLAEETGRALLASPTDDGAGLVLPAKADRADALLGFDSAGNPIAAAGTAEGVTVSAAMKTIVQAATVAAARVAMGLAVGEDVQGHDPATAKLDVPQDWTARQNFADGISAHHLRDYHAMVTCRPGDVHAHKVKTWTGTETDSGLVGVIFDENYLYVCGGNNSDNLIRVTKIDFTDPDNPNTVTIYNGDAGEETAHHMILLGDHLYVSCLTSPGRVVQISKSDMTKVATWTGSTGQNTAKFMTSDGTYVYVCLYDSSPGMIAKIDPSDMTTASMWVGASHNTFPQGIVWTGTELMVALDLVPFEIVRIDPATMATVTLPYADNRFLDSRQAVGDGTTTRAGQRVPMSNGHRITGVDLLLDKVGSPTGTATVRIRQTSDDSVVGTLGTVDVSTLPSTAANPIWVPFRAALPIEIQNTEDHYVLIEYSSGDVSNYLGARYDSTDRTGGVRAKYAASYSTDANQDASIRIYPNNTFYGTNDTAWNNGDTLGNICLSADGRLYATTYAKDPDKLIRIDWPDMIGADTLTLASGENNATAPIAVTGKIFIPCNVSPGKLVYVEDTPGSGLVRRGCWTGASGKSHFYHCAYDGLYTFVGASIAPPEIYRKIIWPINEVAT